MDYGPQAPINTISYNSVAQMGVSYTHGVACWYLYALERCKAALSACCLLPTWYMSGLCAREKGQKLTTF